MIWDRLGQGGVGWDWAGWGGMGRVGVRGEMEMRLDAGRRDGMRWEGVGWGWGRDGYVMEGDGVVCGMGWGFRH
mgnify:CR=1 FL=1